MTPVRKIRLNVAVTKSLLMAASIGMVVPLHAAPPRPTAPATEGGANRRVPKREDAEAEVPGTRAVRADGTYVALSAQGGPFSLRFLNAEKERMDLPCERALVRWQANGKNGEERCVLQPNGTRDALVGNVFVRPPFNFKVLVTLLGADEKAIETVVVDFRG